MTKFISMKLLALLLMSLLATTGFAAPPQETDANFVRTGLAFTVTGANIAADGTVQVRFKMADSAGAPLDRLGVVTPGRVSPSFIIARIPAGASEYVSYITRPQGPSPITGKTATQATGENGGVFTQVADGEYIYTFLNKLQNVDPNVTHTVAVYGSRNLTEFDLGTQYADAVFSWVPSGAAVTTVRDVIKTATCNKCHYSMGFHGGSRKSVEVCILCHTQQTTDPDTGNTVDMPVMIHKIHMGSSLPSVKAGGKYIIVGHQQTVADYSEVAFPANIQRCTVCHEQSGPNKATQSDAMFKPSVDACGSCHDNVDFKTGKNHLGLPQVSNALCANCHIKQGEEWFDKSIVGAHAVDNDVATLVSGGVNVKIDRIIDGTAGKTPTVQLILTDNKGQGIAPADLSRLTVRYLGPTTDYGPGVSETALTAGGNSAGYTWWTFAKPIPADAKGSYAMSVEARRDVVLRAGTPTQATGRAIAKNQTTFFSVDGSPVKARRTIVSTAKCNDCHFSIGFHGGGRNTVENCPQCHNGSLTAGTGAAAVSLDFPVMIHRIHTGKELERPYKVGNTSFNEVGYPGDRRVCSQCHVGGSENLPLQEGLKPVSDPGGPLKTMGVATAACTGCHDSLAAASHILANTTALGESCEVCHDSSAEFSVARVHKR